MGNISSNSSYPSTANEGELFTQIIRDPKGKLAQQQQQQDKHRESDDHGDNKLPKKLGIDTRARILRRISYLDLWNRFLEGSYTSFALSPAEMQSLFNDIATNMIPPSATTAKTKKAEQDEIEAEIKDYMSLVLQLAEKDSSQTFDILAVCSSALLFSGTPIETKVDQLFIWISLDPESSEFNYEDFLVAMRSFERGLSYALGHIACSEHYIKEITSQWMALADPQHKGIADQYTRINAKHFFDFCLNRQHLVRKLLEALPQVEVIDNKNLTLHEVIDNDDLVKEPMEGDQWMANPAWKKTAERMVTKAVADKYVNVKPSSNLELDWVHGYRGFDCRNNLAYVDEHGQQVIFSAAALGIVQDNTAAAFKDRRQHYFSEHGDDIICLTSVMLSAGPQKATGKLTLIASGEIGKLPAIYLYSWFSHDDTFQSLACLKGFHQKGVAQLAFSEDGRYLFSVGVEYSIAIYDSQVGSKTFGKMIASSKGPKDRICHVTALAGGGGEGEYTFITSGEKHAITWKLNKQGILKEDQIKLAANKNKIFLCIAAVSGGNAIMGTSEGDLFLVSNGAISLAAIKKTGSYLGHQSKSAINAIYSNQAHDVLVSGDKDGKVVIWNVSNQGAALAISYEFLLTGYSISAHADGLTLPTGGGPTAAASSSSSSSHHVPIANSIPHVGSASPMHSKGGKGVSAAATGEDHNISSSALKGKVQSIKDATTPVPAVRAVHLCASGDRLVVGTQTCEIIEYSLEGGHAFDQVHGNGNPTISSRKLVCGHFKDEVWGLAVRPVTETNYQEGSHYATVGDDGFLRIWHLEEHRMVTCIDLHGVVRAIAYSPDGCYLAIGFGGSIIKKKNREDGMVKILRIDKAGADYHLVQVSELKEAKQWISVIKYSPDGSTLAVGARDNSIYLYSVPNQYKRKVRFGKHNAGINQFDFSADGKYLQSCCSAYEILFSEANTGAQITDGATRLVATPWHSWTCTLGWPVIGIWSGSMDGSDINNCDRSPSGKYLATCDDFGKVNLFRYPAIQDKGAEHNTYHGHSSHVTCVRWASVFAGSKGSGGGVFHVPNGDDFLISTGGEDKCVFQWRHIDNKDLDAKKEGAAPVFFTKTTKQINKRRSTKADWEEDDNLRTEDVDDSGEAGMLDGPGGGDEFMAIKPWLGAIVAPTAWTTTNPQKLPPFAAALGDFGSQHRAFQEEAGGEVVSSSNSEKKGGKGSASDEEESRYEGLIQGAENVLQHLYESGYNDPSPPNNDDLELEWVHGYNGYDCRNNVFYVAARNSSSKNKQARYVVYFAAALGVLLDPLTQTQKYFKGHNDDIISMAMFAPPAKDSPTIMATGQLGKGNVYVWEVPSMATLAVVNPKQKNVQFLAFSPDGRLLITMGLDQTTEKKANERKELLTVVVTDWKSHTILTTVNAQQDTTLGMAMNSSLKIANGSGLAFMTCGDKILRLWTLTGRNIISTKYVTSTCGGTKIQAFLCCLEIQGKFLVGCEDGSIYVIPVDGKGVKKQFDHLPAGATAAATGEAKDDDGKAGKKKEKGGGGGKKKANNSVTAMTHCHLGSNVSYLLTGSKDGTISVWDSSELNIKDTPTWLYSFEIGEVGVEDILAKQIQALHVNESLVLDSRGKQFLLVVGTRGCDILEMHVDLDKKKAQLFTAGGDGMQGILLRAHCNDELWGLATHPTRPEYCSVGDDKTLRFYALESKRMLAVVPLGHFSRSCCYSNDGSLLAVGFGGRVGRGKETGGGMVRLYTTDHSHPQGVQKVAERQDSKQWISDIKFSSDGHTVAAGAHDCKIYIYTVAKTANNAVELKLRTTFMKHNSVINHLDLSSDGRFMQSNCSAYELLFCDTSNGKQIPAAHELKDVKWATWTCTLGWPVQGIWSAGMDGSDINAVSRSHSGHLLATGDDFGKVNIFRYPVLDNTQCKAISYPGHSSHVMNVRWSCGDVCLISAGGNDKCLMQWRHQIAESSGGALHSQAMPSASQAKAHAGGSSKVVKAAVNPKTLLSSAPKAKPHGYRGQSASAALAAAEMDAAEESDENYEIDIGHETDVIEEHGDHHHAVTKAMAAEAKHHQTIGSSSSAPSAGGRGGKGGSGNSVLDMMMDEGPEGGDESMAVKPWVGAVRAPKHPPHISANAPAVEMTLDWVHGYACAVSYARPNLFYNVDQQVIYLAAALGVLFDRRGNSKGGGGGGGKTDDRSQFQQTFFKGHDDDVDHLSQ